MKPHSTYDLIIIGAGISGLMALRHALKAKLNVLCLEKASDVGGLWRDLPDWQDLQTRKEDWAINNTPIESEFRPHIHQNIKALVQKYSLQNHIEFNTPVKNLKWAEGQWVVTTPHGEWTAKNVIIATGIHNKPKIPKVEKTGSKIGEYHSSIFFDPTILSHKKVTVVGGGASGFDCLELALKHKADEINWVYRSTRWFIPTRSKYESADLRGIAYHQMSGAPMEEISQAMRETLNKRYEKLGLEEIKPPISFDYSNQQLVAGRPLLIKNLGMIKKHQGEIKSFKEKLVTTNKNKSFETDILIWATGYNMDLSWTGLEAYQNLTSSSEIRKKLGTLFVSLDYPNLYFTGASILDTNATAPLVFSVIARSLISSIKGTCKLPKTPILNYVNHWDMIKLLAKYDRAHYFPFFWKIKYFLKAFYYNKFKNRQISI